MLIFQSSLINEGSGGIISIRGSPPTLINPSFVFTHTTLSSCQLTCSLCLNTVSQKKGDPFFCLWGRNTGSVFRSKFPKSADTNKDMLSAATWQLWFFFLIIQTLVHHRSSGSVACFARKKNLNKNWPRTTWDRFSDQPEIGRLVFFSSLRKRRCSTAKK